MYNLCKTALQGYCKFYPKINQNLVNMKYVDSFSITFLPILISDVKRVYGIIYRWISLLFSQTRRHFGCNIVSVNVDMRSLQQVTVSQTKHALKHCTQFALICNFLNYKIHLFCFRFKPLNLCMIFQVDQANYTCMRTNILRQLILSIT